LNISTKKREITTSASENRRSKFEGNEPEKADRLRNAKSGGELVFGRVTYEMMKSFWPTPMAAEQFPDVAKGMNESPKVVFSRTMDEATWNNTRLIKDDLENEVRKLKDESGDHLVVMGSGTIVSQLAQAAWLTNTKWF
jgi:dihydrofolate reductase